VRHVLVVANETLPGAALFERVRERVGEGDLVTVIAPVNVPSQGYVVYEDTRRAAAGRRLDRTLARLREVGVPAYGLVVEASPPDAVRDALATLEPRPDEVIVSTHPNPRSGWLRKDLVEQIRKAAGAIPVEHVVVDLKEERETNVLVIANETVIGEPLLEKIRARAARSPASFLLICPQSDPHEGEHPEAERRLRRALAILRADGIEAHGQIAHPDPYTAAVHAVRDERVDEIIVSTFPGERSGWLRRDVVERIRKETGLPVEHVVTAPELVGASV
jgi:hypothetical protein